MHCTAFKLNRIESTSPYNVGLALVAASPGIEHDALTANTHGAELKPCRLIVQGAEDKVKLRKELYIKASYIYF